MCCRAANSVVNIWTWSPHCHICRSGVASATAQKGVRERQTDRRKARGPLDDDESTAHGFGAGGVPACSACAFSSVPFGRLTFSGATTLWVT